MSSDVHNGPPARSAEHSRSEERSAGSREAVVFFTHLFDHSIERRYQKLKADLGKLAQIFILAPLGTSIPREYSDEGHFFDYEKLRSGAARVNGDKLLPGNVHLVELDFYRHHPGFDYYWFVEYDVVFTGNWARLLDAVKDDRADFLAAHIRSFAEEPKWPWWETLDLPGCALPQADWLRSFVPIYRISHEGLRSVEEHVKLGWSGHFEGLIPCIMRSAGLSIADLGGTGAWTPKDRRYRFYSSASSAAGVFLNAGTHRYRPPHLLPLFRRNTIFHPIKDGSFDWKSRIVQFVTRRYLRELHLRLAVSFYHNLLSFWWGLFRKLERSHRAD